MPSSVVLYFAIQKNTDNYEPIEVSRWWTEAPIDAVRIHNSTYGGWAMYFYKLTVKSYTITNGILRYINISDSLVGTCNITSYAKKKTI